MNEYTITTRRKRAIKSGFEVSANLPKAWPLVGGAGFKITRQKPVFVKEHITTTKKGRKTRVRKYYRRKPHKRRFQ